MAARLALLAVPCTTRRLSWWAGAGPEIAQAVPELSDRLLSERMKELERRGIVQRTVISGPPLRVEYSLSQMGRELEPALCELQLWANRWLGERRVPTRV
jgi:DNA-binding HxlR family transcriptional regulator